MTRVSTHFFILFSLWFLFTGCVQRELLISNTTSNNGWAEQTNVEDVDISDLDENLTETQTVITENMSEQRMERIIFPVAEYNRLSRMGKGTVKGTIFVSDAYNKRVLGAGTRLYLNPKTTYSDQWYRESYIGGYKMEKADSRLFNYLRFTASNSQGNFAFYGVPSGQYYLIGTVTCAEECGYNSSKSIRIATLVTVKGNQIIVKNLSRLLD